jgi:hypothetical protein
MSQNPLVSSTTKTIFRHLATGTHLHYCQYLWQLQQSLYNEVFLLQTKERRKTGCFSLLLGSYRAVHAIIVTQFTRLHNRQRHYRRDMSAIRVKYPPATKIWRRRAINKSVQGIKLYASIAHLYSSFLF